MRLAVLLLLCMPIAVEAQIIASTTPGPAARVLPKVVQGMDAEEYAAWAEWNNTLAQRYAEQFNDQEARYYKGWSTTTNGTGLRAARRYGGFNMSQLTVPFQVEAPHLTKEAVVYNPFCKPIGEGATSPDWNNLFCIYKGEIKSVNDIAKTLIVPIPKEALYEQLLQPFRYTRVERVPIQ